MQALKRTDNHVFIPFPEVDGPEWTSEVLHLFRKNHPYVEEPWKHFLYCCLDGTTFSGHCTRTTMGNTWRSYLYALWYCQMAGIRTPYLNKELYIAAAGDDVVIFCAPHLAEAINASILRHTSRTKNNADPVGLG